MFHRVCVFGYLTVVAFLLAHMATGLLAQALIPSDEPPPASSANDAEATGRTDLHRAAQEILAGALFPVASARRAGAGVAGFEGLAQVSSLDVAKKIKLVGTVLTDGREPFAVIEDRTTRKQMLYHLHDHIEDLGELREIRPDGVMIERGGEREFVEAAAVQASTAAAGDRASMPGAQPDVRVLDRRAVAYTLDDLPKLLSQARALPFYVNGKLDGWRIEAITPASVFDQIGLRSGDVVQRVNGVEIRDPSMMLTLLHQVKDEPHVRLDVLRGSQKLSLRYDIR